MRLVLGTKKGLLVLEKGAKHWRAQPLRHEGVHVSFAFFDGRTQTLWAALDHGHWGAKLSRSKDGGGTWQEVAAPKYDEKTSLTPVQKKKPSLVYMYFMGPGRKEEPRRLYVGTVPGGLFVSEDDGATFTLVESLWDH